MVKNNSSDPVIIITGASSGIGEATARLFASNGYRVVLAARRIEQLNNLAQDIRSKGGSPFVVVTDITKNDQIENLVSQTLNHFGQIDILLNNAGLGRLEWLEKLDPINDIEYQIKGFKSEPMTPST